MTVEFRTLILLMICFLLVDAITGPSAGSLCGNFVEAGQVSCLLVAPFAHLYGWVRHG